MPQHTDDLQTIALKRFCLETLNADLVGVANIERCANAPVRMRRIQKVSATGRSQKTSAGVL